MPATPRDGRPTRRAFVRAVGASGLGAAAMPRIGVPSTGTRPESRGRSGGVVPMSPEPADSAVARLFGTLTTDQREAICFPHDHPLRSRVEHNWAIVGPTIGDLEGAQRELCREILRGITSEDGFDRFMRQMGDDSGGFEAYHVALFGTPGTVTPFEWVLTGRHVTLRADGDRSGGWPFGGPIFYGHAPAPVVEVGGRSRNVWWDQAERADALFRSLDGDRRARALAESPLAPGPGGERGIRVGDLDGRQKRMVLGLIGAMLSPFSEASRAGVLALLDSAGGIDPLRLTDYGGGGAAGGRIRDVWKVEGPAFSWHFHGTPHVHAWVDFAGQAPGGRA
ncbi:DUF3500 domain-containing protein [Tautonia plasticadhaerens]|uniref:DUF3500 domain-containing protein n=1 Tax=Tautonia plasticadhaerens TaxID=2527974 RepID=A0A518H6N5_9BACT|nr:DUF3500 domain-containing protein [Tautonia plasticadhaerens]QDV36502.1 hypothetical protein ElP_44280 [Tautonia plasticadhaerens]